MNISTEATITTHDTDINAGTQAIATRLSELGFPACMLKEVSLMNNNTVDT